MATDPAWLRACASSLTSVAPSIREGLDDAADEIMRLRSELAAEKARTATLEALVSRLADAADTWPCLDDDLLAEARTEVPR
jgi:hypothetical protein